MLAELKSLLENCTLCPRACGVNRLAGQAGFCGAVGTQAEVAKIMIHHWEEPCISGTDPCRGSGTVFFAHCTLRCVYCQNQAISGRFLDASKVLNVCKMDVDTLAQAFLNLQQQGAHNINLVTPTHYLPVIVPAVSLAREQGLHLPIVYNTSGYETEAALERLAGITDVYLCDVKYWTAQTGKAYSLAPDYATVVWDALDAMFRQVGPCVFDERGMLTRGVVVRHLVLPGRSYAAKKIIGRLFERYGNQIVYSIMNQYTPLAGNRGIQEFPELLTSLPPAEYDQVADFAASLGLEYAYLQEGEAISESFIPLW